MSQWLHVKGYVAISDIKAEYSDKSYDDIFGKSWSYDQVLHIPFDDDDAYDEDLAYELEHYPERFMPSGSEGSIEKHLSYDVRNSKAIVEFKGDLRDLDKSDVKNIVKWFNTSINKVEYDDTYLIISYDYKFKEDIIFYGRYGCFVDLIDEELNCFQQGGMK